MKISFNHTPYQQSKCEKFKIKKKKFLKSDKKRPSRKFLQKLTQKTATRKRMFQTRIRDNNWKINEIITLKNQLKNLQLPCIHQLNSPLILISFIKKLFSLPKKFYRKIFSLKSILPNVPYSSLCTLISTRLFPFAFFPIFRYENFSKKLFPFSVCFKVFIWNNITNSLYILFVLI